MKSPEDIELRIGGLLCEEFDRRVAEATLRLPRRCQYNHQQPLDNRRSVYGEPNSLFNRVSQGTAGHVALPVVQTMGLCMLDREDGWRGDICEDPIDAQRCPYFTPAVSPEDIGAAVLAEIEGGETDLAKEVQALCWVLGTSTMRLPWWKKLWAKLFLRVSYEPLQLPARTVLPSGVTLDDFLQDLVSENASVNNLGADSSP